MRNYIDEYKNSMDSLQLSEEQQESLFRSAVQQANHQETVKRHPFRCSVVIAYVIAAALVCTACTAVVVKTVVESFAPVWGGSDSQKSIIEEIGTPINVSDTDHGVTITANAVIGDEHRAWIMYTLSWENGANVTIPEGIPQTIEQYSTTVPSYFLSFGGEKGYYSDNYVFMDADPNDNEITFLETITSFEPLSLDTVTREFSDLTYSEGDWYGSPRMSYPDYEGERWLTAAKGNWKLTFNVNCKDPSISVPLNEKAEIRSNNSTLFQILNIRVSPVSVVITYKNNDDDVTDQIMIEGGEIFITTVSGKTFHTDGYYSSPYSADYTSETVMTAGGSFMKIIPLDEMQSITIGDITYEIPHDK